MPQEAQLIKADFFDNTGGLNLSDAPFRVRDNQAVGGMNYEYTFAGVTGGIHKVNGPTKINTVADSTAKTLGIALHNTTNGVKQVIRATDSKVQIITLDTGTFTTLFEDTASGTQSTFFASGSTQPVVFSQFNTTLANVLWMAGGGETRMYGVVGGPPYKVTENGASPPAGSITTTVTADAGVFVSTGTYYYAVLLRKGSTFVNSNVALDKPATVTVTTQKVTIDLTGITAFDQTKYDQIWIYRSAVGGVSGFTTGDIIAKLASSTTTYDDTGTSISSTQNVPRAGNLVLDNSVLPSGTFKTITSWKRRLVTADKSTVYISDLNKPESWPTANYITVPSGGDITALAVLGFNTPNAPTPQEFLCVFKERELWLITGDTAPNATDNGDYSLKQMDSVGCANQALVVSTGGFLSWLDYRGIYLWNGDTKSIYCSRTIEPLFQPDGDLNTGKFPIGVGVYYRRFNTIYWYLSDKSIGEQKSILKMDLRLTLPGVETTLDSKMLDGVFIRDSQLFATYAGVSMIPPTDKDEIMLVGDDQGFIYKAYNTAVPGTAVDFSYMTKALDMQSPGTTKQFHKVIAWVSAVGDWNLNLDYWSNYKISAQEKSSRAVRLPTGVQNGDALWDVAFWDIAFWDDFSIATGAMVFNLDGQQNNSVGDAITLKFYNSNADQPITIFGFSVIYSVLGLRK